MANQYPERDALVQLDGTDLTGDVCPWCHHVLHNPNKCPHCDWQRAANERTIL